MSKELQALGGELKFLYGSAVTPNSFPERKKIQKISYLLDQFGIESGRYPVIWHYEGPFSFELHFDYYHNSSDLRSLESEASPELFEFKRVFEGVFNDVEKLELYASVVYLNKEYGCNFDRERLAELMALKKPKFSRDEVLASIEFLQAIPQFSSHS